MKPLWYGKKEGRIARPNMSILGSTASNYRFSVGA